MANRQVWREVMFTLQIVHIRTIDRSRHNPDECIEPAEFRYRFLIENEAPRLDKHAVGFGD